MSGSGGFSESEINYAFRKVRNRLRKYYPDEVVLACIGKLNTNPRDRIEHLKKYPPWRLLILIKWTLVHGDYIDSRRRHIKENDFNYLIDLMQIVENHVRMPDEYDNLFLFLRNLAFQQFWLEHDLNTASLARQNLLFSNLDSNHPFQRNFIEKCGISIPHFVELSMMLVTRFIVEKQCSVTSDWFALVTGNYPAGTIDRFIELLSEDIGSLRVSLARTGGQGRKYVSRARPGKSKVSGYLQRLEQDPL